jgi:hypothetical protein
MLIRFSGYQPAEIDQRTRPLREKNLIPQGARGVHAPSIEPLHAALMVLAMVSRRATDAGAVLARAMDLKSVPRPSGQFPQQSLATVLAGGFVMGGDFLKRLEVSCDGAIAWATCTVNGDTSRILFCEDDVVAFVEKFPDTYDAQGEGGCGHRFVIGRGLIDQIALDLREDVAAGYAAEKVSA